RRQVHRLRELRPGLARPGVLAGRDQHLRLHRGRDAAEDVRRPRPRPGDEPGLPLQEPHACAAAAAVHRADRAVDHRLAVDPRSRLQHRELDADRARPDHPARSELARQYAPCDGLADRRQRVARPAVLRHHAAGRPADHLARALRGGDDRRRQHLGPFPLRHPATDEAGDLHRHHVLGDLHLLRLPANLRADPWRSGQCHAGVRHLRFRHRDERRPARPGCGDRAHHGAAAGAVDPGDGDLPQAGQDDMTVGDRNPLARLFKLWLPLGISLLFTLFPFYWMAVTSLKPNQELYSRKVMPLIVHHPTLKHYVDLLTETGFLVWTWNTFVVAVVSTAISLIFGAMLAYPLARIRFAGAALVSFAIAATYLVPQPLLFVPLADIINSLGLGDT